MEVTMSRAASRKVTEYYNGISVMFVQPEEVMYRPYVHRTS